MDADVEVDVVRAEAATVLSAMRLTTGRWMPQLRFERELPPELEQPLVRALRELSARAQLPSDAREVASPFISVLSSPHAHAPVLHAAAAALSNLIGLGLLAGRLDHASDACCEVADAVVGRLSRAELGGGGALGTPEVLEPLAQRLLSLLILLPSSRLSASSLDGCIRAALGAACAERASTQCRIGAEAALTQLTASAFARVRARPAPPAPVVDVLAELLHHFAERAPHPLALEAMLVALRSSGRALGTHGALVEAVRGPVCSAALLLGRSRELSALAQALRLMACVVATLRSRAVGGVGEFWASVLLEHEPPPERQELLLEAAGAWLQLPGIAGFLYVSFDCALHGANLLEQTVASLCVQAMPRADGGALAAPSMLALRALVSLLAALAGGGAGAGADAAGAGAGAGADAGALAGLDGDDSEGEGGGGLGDAARGSPASAIAIRRAGSLVGEDGAAAHSDDDDADDRQTARTLSALGASADGGARGGADAVRQRRELKRTLALAADHFNTKPSKGLALLRARGLLDPSDPSEPERIAAFLLSAPHLSKGAVGDYLGEPGEAVGAVLRAYVKGAGLGGLRLEEGLRALLALFRLPGEAQKISRILEAFAAQHVAMGADASQFADADAAYVLSYSTIMLQTDLHNPAVKKKMSEADFVRANRGINAGADFDADFLRALYASIRDREIKLTPASGAAAASGGGAGAGGGAAAAEVGGGSRRASCEREADADAGPGPTDGAPAAARAAAAAPSDDACDEAHTREHARDMLLLAYNRALAALSVALDAAAEPSSIELALTGLRLLAHAALAHALRERLDKLVLALSTQCAGVLRAIVPGAAGGADAAGAAAGAAGGGGGGGGVSGSGSCGALGVGAMSASGPSPAAAAPAARKLRPMCAEVVRLTRACAPLLRDAWVDVLGLLLALREAEGAEGGVASAAGLRLLPPPLTSAAQLLGAAGGSAPATPHAAAAAAARSPGGARARPLGPAARARAALAEPAADGSQSPRVARAASDACGGAAADGAAALADAAADAPVPAVRLDRALRLRDAPRWSARAQLALMRALQAALYAACADGRRDPDTVSARSCLELMCSLFLLCAPAAAPSADGADGAAGAGARASGRAAEGAAAQPPASAPPPPALWAPLGEALCALCDAAAELPPSSALSAHAVATSLRALLHWPRPAPSAHAPDLRAVPLLPLQPLLCLTPGHLEAHGASVARALALALASAAEAAAAAAEAAEAAAAAAGSGGGAAAPPPAPTPTAAAQPPPSEVLALLQTLAAAGDEGASAAVADALAHAVALCARAAAARPDAAAAGAALAQCAAIAVTAARAPCARSDALLDALRAAHGALLPAQGPGTDAVRALCAIVREQAEACARAGGGGGAAQPAELLVRAATLLTQLLLSALGGERHGWPEPAVWLGAVRALCAAVDALAARRKHGSAGGADAAATADAAELVEQSLLNLVLCTASADTHAPPTLVATLELVRSSQCARETVAALTSALTPLLGGAAAADGSPAAASVPIPSSGVAAS